jgi:hypothetical protein
METVREERRRIAEEKQGTIPTNKDVKKQSVPKTDLTPPPSPQKIEKALGRSKSPIAIPIQKKPSSYSGSSNGNSPRPEKTQ